MVLVPILVGPAVADVRAAEMLIFPRVGHPVAVRVPFRRFVVVDDRALGEAGDDGGVRRVAELDEEVLRAAFEEGVSHHMHRNRSGHAARGNAQGPVRREVVAGGFRVAVGRREVDSHILAERLAEVHGEESAGGAGILFHHGGIGDPHHRQGVVVVDDRPFRGAAHQNRVRHVAEDDLEFFETAFVEGVAQHDHGHDAGCRPGRDDEGAVRGRIVRAGRGGAVRSIVLGEDRETAGFTEGDDEPGNALAAIAFLLHDPSDRHVRRVVVVKDRGGTRRAGDHRIGRAGDPQREGLEAAFIDGVAQDRDRQRAVGLARGDPHHPVRRHVVREGRR